MRYVLIVMLLFSAPAQAEEWISVDNWFEGDGWYIQEPEYSYDERLLVKILKDDIDGGKDATGWEQNSAVSEWQFQCADGKPVKQRFFYLGLYEGYMATGNVEYITYGAQWEAFDFPDGEDWVKMSCDVYQN
ncbi:hypothetical protein N9E22_00105 [Burkholderiales bacterium]|nr:hypothetical protein [Burkholderiales bacterium]